MTSATTNLGDTPSRHGAGAGAADGIIEQGASHKAFRKDIEGLRALAVGLVVVDHAFGWPAGGFIGVDVFFVISGFLITGLLLKEHTRTGRISFADFYRRRARRILPIATLVTALTTAASAVLLLSTRAAGVAVDAAWTLAFAANWRFAEVGTDYFASNQPPSPLQHYWSLAVEEQYYVLWPLLLLAVLTFATRRRTSGSRTFVVLALCGLLFAASLGWAFSETTTAPTTAYFSTFSRAWELLAGAALAISSTWLSRLRHGARVLLGWSGLTGIVASALLIGPESAFPAPWAVLPVLGTMAVIASGTGTRRDVGLLPLTNPLARYVGTISYSLYLWHWPAIIILTAVLPDRRLHRLLAVTLAVCLSILSFHLLEDPIRRSKWLEPRRRRRAADVANKPAVGHRRLALLLAASLGVLASGGAAAALVQRYGPAPGTGLSASGGDASPGALDGAPDPEAELGAEIAAAIAAQDWPALTPALDHVSADQAPELNDLGCVNDWDVVGQHCVYGEPNAPHTAVLIGDSTTISWLPGIIAALGPEGWQVDSYGKYGCPAAATTVRMIDPIPYTDCNDHRELAFEQVKRVRPDLVILGGGEGYIANLPSGTVDDAADREWSDAVAGAIARVAPYTDRVAVLSSAPYGADLTQCATAGSRPANCVTDVHPDWWRTSAAERSAVTTAAEAGTNVTYVDAHAWICTPEGRCPGFVNGIVVRADTNHVSATYSRYLAPVLARALVPPPA